MQISCGHIIGIHQWKWARRLVLLLNPTHAFMLFVHELRLTRVAHKYARVLLRETKKEPRGRKKRGVR